MRPDERYLRGVGGGGAKGSVAFACEKHFKRENMVGRETEGVTCPRDEILCPKGAVLRGNPQPHSHGITPSVTWTQNH